MLVCTSSYGIDSALVVLFGAMRLSVLILDRAQTARRRCSLA
jgi:hypothetical protein